MKILDRPPIPEDRTSLRFGDRYITIHANQILVWVSVHLSEVVVPEVNLRGLRALRDPGKGLGFPVQARHRREWAGIAPGRMEPRGDLTMDGKVPPRREATVWLSPNVPGRQHAVGVGPPFRLDL